MIWPHRSPRPPSSARIQPSPSLPPACREMRSQSRSTSSTAGRSPAVARTRWARLVTTTGQAPCWAISSRRLCSGAPTVMSPVRAVRTASERLTAANFRRTSRACTSSVNSAKGKGRWRTTMGSPHRSAARRIASGGDGKGPPEAEHDGRGLRAVQRPDVLGLLLLVAGEQHAGGEHHLAAGEHHAHVGVPRPHAPSAPAGRAGPLRPPPRAPRRGPVPGSGPGAPTGRVPRSRRWWSWRTSLAGPAAT